jgi:hypothetical protein
MPCGYLGELALSWLVRVGSAPEGAQACSQAYAYINLPRGSGMSRPNSLAVSIHSSMIP